MKNPKPALLLCALAFAFTARCDDSPAGNKPAAGEDLALFENGDSLRGAMAGCDKAGLYWRTVYESRPVVVTVKYLKEIQLRRRAIPANAAQPAHDVLLLNGDMLPGVIVSLDDKSLLLETWYAGRLAIPRAMIKSIIAAEIFGYKGPAGMDGWVTGTAAGHEATWSCKDGILSNMGPGSIGRDMKLKAPARIQFDLTLQRDSSNAIIYLCSATVDKPGNSYAFQVNASDAAIDAARYSPGSANIRIGKQVHFPAEEVMAGGPAFPEKYHFEIFVNKEMKTIWLYVNGSLVERYMGLDDLPKMGGGVIFEPDGTSPMEISKIKVSAWDGGLDEAARADIGANEDSIAAEHRGSMRGKLKSIANGKVVFTSSDGDQELQVGDIEVIRFSAAAASQPKTETNTMRALLRPPCRVTMEIESWDEKQVTATSPDFGRAVFKPEAFRLLQFNFQNQPATEGGSAIDADDGGD